MQIGTQYFETNQPSGALRPDGFFFFEPTSINICRVKHWMKRFESMDLQERLVRQAVR